MKNSLILLAEIIATDDDFAQSFYSKSSIEEKFKLAKTKFADLSKEDFIEFYNELQKLEKSNIKLSKADLENISGGVGNSKLKLAALAFLGLFLSPMAMSNIASAALPSFYDPMLPYEFEKIKPKTYRYRKFLKCLYERPAGEILSEYQKLVSIESHKDPSILEDSKGVIDYLKKLSDCSQNEEEMNENLKGEEAEKKEIQEKPLTEGEVKEFLNIFLQTKLGKTVQILTTVNYYSNIYKNIIVPLRNQDPYVNQEHTMTISPQKSCLLTPTAFKHIVYGDYHYKFSYLMGGGHTKNVLNIMKKVNEGKLKEAPNNLSRDIYKQLVLNNDDNNFFKQINENTFSFLDSMHGQPEPDINGSKWRDKIFFPDHWAPKDIVNAIEQVLKFGKEVADGGMDSRCFVGTVDKTVVKVVTNYNVSYIKSAFPISVVPDKFDSYFEENKINDFYDAGKANPQQFYENLSKYNDKKFKEGVMDLKKIFLNPKKDLNIDKLLFLYESIISKNGISKNNEFTAFLKKLIDISNQSNSSDDDTQIELNNSSEDSDNDTQTELNNSSDEEQFDIYRFINEEQISLEDFLLSKDQIEQKKPLTEYQLNEIEKFFWTTEFGQKVKKYLNTMACSSTVVYIRECRGKPKNSVISISGINKIKIAEKTKSNILFGSYDEHLGFLETPGHTKLAIDLADAVTKQKTDKLSELSMAENYIMGVLGGSREPYYKDKTKNKNISKYVFFDSKEGPKTATLFPEDWTIEKIIDSIKEVLEMKQEVNSQKTDTRAFVGIAYGIPIKVVTNNEVTEVLDAYPIDILPDEIRAYYENNKVAPEKEFFKKGKNNFKEKRQTSTTKKETQPKTFEKSKPYTDSSSKNSEKFKKQLTLTNTQNLLPNGQKPAPPSVQKPTINAQKPTPKVTRPATVEKRSENKGIQIQFSNTQKAPTAPSNPSNDKT